MPAGRRFASGTPCPVRRPARAGRQPTRLAVGQGIHHGRPSRVGRAGAPAVAVLLLATVAIACGGDRGAPAIVEAGHALDRCAPPNDSILFLVFVDRSGSMRRDWETVRHQLRVLVPALAQGSWLRVEVFDAAVLVPPPVDAQLSHDTIRRRVEQQLASLPPPAPSAYTDLGRAMARAADILELRRMPATFLFWISDGQHDPDPHGRSPYTHERAPAFDTLRQRFARILGGPDRVVRSTVIPIGPEAVRAGALIQRVVPGTQVLDGPIAGQRIAAELEPLIRGAQEQALAGRVRPELAEPRLRIELAHGIQTTRAWLRAAELDALIRSHARCVTYRITSTPDSPLVLPGSAATITVPVDPPRQWSRLLPWSAARRDTFPARGRPPWHQPVAIRFEPRAKLEALRVPGEDELRTDRVHRAEVSGIVEYRPISWWSFLVAAAVLLIAATVLVRAVLPPVRIRLSPTRRLGPTPPGAGLDESRAPHQYVIDTGCGRITVAVRRRHPLAKRSNLRLTIVAADRMNAAVATPQDDGRYQLHRIASGLEAEPGCYVVWSDDPAAPWRATESELRLMTDYVGYQIKA